MDTIKVLAVVPVKFGEEEMYKHVCQVADGVIDIYCKTAHAVGVYFPKLRIRFVENAQGKKRPILSATIGEAYEV